jgi:hypothetical protein
MLKTKSVKRRPLTGRTASKKQRQHFSVLPVDDEIESEEEKDELDDSIDDSDNQELNEETAEEKRKR